MPLLTPAQIQEHYNTDASDDAITRFITAEEAAIERLIGPYDSDVTQTFYYPPKPLVLKQQAIAVVSVTEDDELLDSDEYLLLDGGRLLFRKGWIYDRSYIPWGHEVVVVYTPYDDSSQRIRALIYLVGLNLAQNGYRVERNTELLQEPLNYQRERVRTLRSLQRWPTIA